MKTKAKEELGAEHLIGIVDKGYYSGEQFAKWQDHQIQVIAPHPDKGGGQERGYTKGYFNYNKETDTYRCPQGETLPLPVQKKANRKGDRYYNRAACATCEAKSKCSPSTPYRTIVCGMYDGYTEEVDAFTAANRDLYNMRKELVEHPFGTIKRTFGSAPDLVRGNICSTESET